MRRQNNIRFLRSYEWEVELATEIHAIRLSSLLFNKKPCFSTIGYGDIILQDLENCNISGPETSKFLNDLYIAYNKRAKELRAFPLMKVQIELARYLEFREDLNLKP